ncbi:MAG TPA: hypothetical protein VN694_14680 [Caulobacteraceae bacterium]|nr:hypothetical protein [Caulobacteraceae bacterium]
MISKLLRRAMLLATTASVAVASLPVPAALAQDQGYGGYQGGYNQPPPNYPDQPPPQQPPPGYNGYDQQGGYDQDQQPPPDYNGYNQQPGYNGYNQAPPPGFDAYANQAPAGYDPSQPPPPPPGYQGAPLSEAQQRADAAYATAAQQWAAQNCVKSGGNVAAGAVIGGIFGALIGAGVSGYGHTGAGTAIGAAIGGTAGAAIASGQQGATSPGCPPGYVLRGGAPGFYYSGYAGPYMYAAPSWYQPWIWYGGEWLYRPYPYHTWYYGHYGRYYGRGGHDRGGYGYHHYH